MSGMKWIVAAAAVEAAVTGLVLIVSPPLFAWLILGAELSDPGRAMGRLTGIAMVGAGLAAWPAPVPTDYPASAVRALLIYNLLVRSTSVTLGSPANWWASCYGRRLHFTCCCRSFSVVSGSPWVESEEGALSFQPDASRISQNR